MKRVAEEIWLSSLVLFCRRDTALQDERLLNLVAIIFPDPLVISLQTGTLAKCFVTPAVPTILQAAFYGSRWCFMRQDVQKQADQYLERDNVSAVWMWAVTGAASHTTPVAIKA